MINKERFPPNHSMIQTDQNTKDILNQKATKRMLCF